MPSSFSFCIILYYMMWGKDLQLVGDFFSSHPSLTALIADRLYYLLISGHHGTDNSFNRSVE
ncbi:hypothetical protein P5673_000808 [Acropora cervicornis]|uniref:Uncharacterized protein n=1 Tax=Acropora cervicornis TaxID=6130 RepID=A0AAD9R7S2_ACRCE|nr:hypothetical protein P5673_000808 [Acropora cervicornis]